MDQPVLKLSLTTVTRCYTWVGVMYPAERANKPVHAVLDMPIQDAMLFQRGQIVRRVKRYQLAKG